MSGVASPTPAQNSFMPPPVPVLSTTGVFKPDFWPNCSATAVVNGKTVDEPTMRIWSRACACAATATSAVAAAAMSRRFMVPPDRMAESRGDASSAVGAAFMPVAMTASVTDSPLARGRRQQDGEGAARADACSRS